MLYIATTADDLELPVAVAGSTGELSRIMQIDQSNIIRGIKHPANKPRQFKFFAVEEDCE